MKNMIKQKKGFTLIELIVVIAVIGILVLLAAPKFLGYTKDTKLTQIQNDIKVHETAIGVKLIDDEGFLENLDWQSVNKSKLEEFKDSNSLFNKKGLVNDSDNKVDLDDEYLTINKDDKLTNTKLKGDFIVNKGGQVFYHEDGFSNEVGDKEEVTDPEDFTLLTDDDFEFVSVGSAPNSYEVNGETTKGYFHYVGGADKVIIPHKIMGNEVKDYYRMFFNNGTDGNGATVTAVISDNPKVTTMREMFRSSQATSLDFGLFDTSKVADMYGMFWNSLAKSLDLSNFDTGNVTNMRSMFSDSQAATLNLSNFDTSKVADMKYMFRRYQATELDLNSFDTSSVTDMNGMFYQSQATTLDISSFDTSNVTNMYGMFRDSQAKSLDLSSFDTSNVTSMAWMFDSSKATSLVGVDKFDTSNVTDMEGMFAESHVATLDLSSFDTSNVTDMSEMFALAKATIGYAKSEDDAKRFNDSKTIRPPGLYFKVKGQ